MSNDNSKSNAEERSDELTPEELGELRRRDREASDYFKMRLAKDEPRRETTSSPGPEPTDKEK